MQAINGCAFCLSNRKSWTGHTVEVCVELANVVCGYCKEKGHTPKKCPKSALKKQRDTEWAQQQEAKKKREEEKFPTLVQDSKGKSFTLQTNKKNTWSSLVVNSLSTEEREQMEQKHHEEREKSAENRRKEATRKKQEWEERKRQWEIRNKRRIVREYGLEKDNGICQEGSFWYFFTEGTNDDIPEAKTLREDSNNQWEFKKYLKEKYWVNWLSRSEYSEDDCPILDRWRWEEEKAEYEAEVRERQELADYLKQEDDLINDMKSKVESGEITQQEYDDWKYFKEIDDDYAYQGEGDTCWYAHQQQEKEYKAWQDRSEARQKK